jgi:hypothetical protein
MKKKRGKNRGKNIGKSHLPSTLHTKRRKENLELQQTKEDKAKKVKYIPLSS